AQNPVPSYLKLNNWNVFDGSLRMIQTSDSNYVSVGYWQDSAWIMKLNLLGEIIWAKKYRYGAQATRLYDIEELSDGRLVAVGESDTVESQLTSPYPVKAALLLETDPCGEVLRVRHVCTTLDITALNLRLLLPTVGYGLCPAPGGGYALTGQTLYTELNTLLPLTFDSIRKTAYLMRVNSQFLPQQSSVFDFPASDSSVAYDLAPHSNGYALTGAYFDKSNDSLYLLAFGANASLQRTWFRTWSAAPLSAGGLNFVYAIYHAGITLEALSGDRLLLAGSRFLPLPDILDPWMAEIGPGGVLLQEKVFYRPGIDIGLRARASGNAYFLAGGQGTLTGTNDHLQSCIYETDLLMNPMQTYLFDDSSGYDYLATSVIPVRQPDGCLLHVAGGVRFLRNSLGYPIDSTHDVTFLSSASYDPISQDRTYYGGPVVQIEDIIIRDTTDCRPQAPVHVLNTCLGTDVYDLLGMVVYPNPAQDQLQLQWEVPLSKATALTMSDMAGRRCLDMLLPAGTVREGVSLAALPAGLYVLSIGGRSWRIEKK
ncbi:MAG: T9SS C-terminal target domain-containing protein, partial [Bacteroidetes bacterium]